MHFTSQRISPLRRLLCLLLAALLVPLLPMPAARAQSDTLWLETQFDSPGSAKPRAWQFPYRDDPFTSGDSAYDHLLAQSSLGLALSAFRSKHRTQDQQDVAVRAYLTGAGFTDLVSADYEKVPTVDTVSTMIGRKELDGFTVVAVAICGGGYGNEWTSNFTIGDTERHVGFNDASQRVQARIRSYLIDQGIDGAVKLWISGYSRAAAISNLTAADMTDSGLFADVFAYTFATPRTTKAPKEYPNIFNILGKFDPVPMVPAPEWGYERNGVTLYTPAEETDSDYQQKKALADAVSRKLTGIAFFNNTEMNNTLRIILDYLMTLIPDSATYEAHMQDIMISVWKDRGLGNLSAKLVQMMEDEQLLTENSRQEMEQLLDYLSLVTYTTVTGGNGSWNSQTTMLDNLAHEHSPDVYVSWLFSTDDPAKLYSASDSFMKVTWSSGATANVFGAEGRFIFSIDGNGRVSYSTDEPAWAASMQPLAERPVIACEHKNTTTVVTLPRDNTYLIYLQAKQDETMYYIGAEYRIDAVHAKVDKTTIVDMKAGEDYVILSMSDKDAGDDEHLLGSSTQDFELWDETMPYSPTFMAMLSNTDVFHLTFAQMAMIAGAVLMLLLLLITWLIVHFVRRRKRRRRAEAQAPQADGNAEQKVG